MYFFYPETASRSLEEMDTIFRKTDSIFSLVRVAREEPHRYGKNGELLINYEETDEHKRRASHATTTHVEGGVMNHSHANPDYFMEKGVKNDTDSS